jgi:hypothetical protein
MYDSLKNWLLEDDNPAVKFRSQTEILGLSGDRAAAASWIFGNMPESWHEQKGLWYRYYITALAECGLSYGDIPMKSWKGPLQSWTQPLNAAVGTLCF